VVPVTVGDDQTDVRFHVSNTVIDLHSRKVVGYAVADL
jgi:transposase InsO family protein